MTATEELRALLDGRGVEYREHKSMTRGGMEPFTRFYIDDRVQAFIEASPHTEDVLLTMRCTPQQAVDATLRRGECEMEYATDGMMKGWWVCSECGKASDTIESCAGRSKPMFCGNCGKAVKR